MTVLTVLFRIEVYVINIISCLSTGAIAADFRWKSRYDDQDIWLRGKFT